MVLARGLLHKEATVALGEFPGVRERVHRFSLLGSNCIMKSRVRKLGMALAVCAAGLGMAGTSSMALAGDSFTLQATATVQGNCKLRSGVAAGGTLTLAFGTLDASTITADAVQTVQFQYSCNNGTAVTADVGASSGQTVAQLNSTTYPLVMAGSVSGSMSANVGFSGWADGAGQNPANYRTVTVTGTLPLAVVQAAAAGDYTGSITITINP